jgi:hypothetical protein
MKYQSWPSPYRAVRFSIEYPAAATWLATKSAAAAAMMCLLRMVFLVVVGLERQRKSDRYKNLVISLLPERKSIVPGGCVPAARPGM